MTEEKDERIGIETEKWYVSREAEGGTGMWRQDLEELLYN